MLNSSMGYHRSTPRTMNENRKMCRFWCDSFIHIFHFSAGDFFYFSRLCSVFSTIWAIAWVELSEILRNVSRDFQQTSFLIIPCWLLWIVQITLFVAKDSLYFSFPRLLQLYIKISCNVNLPWISRLPSYKILIFG